MGGFTTMNAKGKKPRARGAFVTILANMDGIPGAVFPGPSVGFVDFVVSVGEDTVLSLARRVWVC
jgi:hypothetical protein